jgi:hypothetical protein
MTIRKPAVRVMKREIVMLAASVRLLSWYFEREYMEEKVSWRKTVRWRVRR